MIDCIQLSVECCWLEGWLYLPTMCVLCIQCACNCSCNLMSSYPDQEIMIMVGMVQSSLYSLCTLVSRYVLIIYCVVC